MCRMFEDTARRAASPLRAAGRLSARPAGKRESTVPSAQPSRAARLVSDQARRSCHPLSAGWLDEALASSPVPDCFAEKRRLGFGERQASHAPIARGTVLLSSTPGRQLRCLASTDVAFDAFRSRSPSRSPNSHKQRPESTDDRTVASRSANAESIDDPERDPLANDRAVWLVRPPRLRSLLCADEGRSFVLRVWRVETLTPHWTEY